MSKRACRSAPQAVYSNEVNQREIEEPKRGLTEDQRKVEQQSQPPPHSDVETGSRSQQFAPGERTGTANFEVASEPRRDQIADAERALLFKARFASNLVSADSARRQTSASQTRPLDPSLPFAETVPSLGASGLTRATDGPLTGQPPKQAPGVNVNSAEGASTESAPSTLGAGQFASTSRKSVPSEIRAKTK